MNVTNSIDDLPLSRAADLIWKIGLPLILFLGSFGNTMSIVVHHRLSKKRKSEISIYLLALAVADLMLLYSSLLVQWLNNLFNYEVLAAYTFLCKILIWLIYTSGAMCAWLLVAVTVQRAVAVVWPHRVNSLITRSRSIVLALSLTGTLMTIHMHILFGWGVVDSITSNDTITQHCTILTEDYFHFFYRIWSWVDLLVFSLVPFIILLGSNTVLLKTVVSSVQEARHKLSVGNKQQVTSRKKTASSMTFTLIVLSFTFVSLTGPICVYLLMKPYVFDDLNVNDEREAVHRFVYAVINFLWYSNSAINFYLYCLTGSKFRSELKNIFTQLLTCLNQHEKNHKLIEVF